MRAYNTQHAYYCGVDLHARSLFVHVLDDKGQTRLERDIAASPATFLDAITPYREGLVVGCECMFAWYWLADLWVLVKSQVWERAYAAYLHAQPLPQEVSY